MRVLGIETSCDETAAAIYDSRTGVVAQQIFSQIALHARYGGVVPELAARSHGDKIVSVVAAVLADAGMALHELDGIAVTTTPGLPGSLLVGIGFAKAIAYAAGVPLIGVNHLEGHIFSAWVGREPVFPYLCMTASGGHTALYLVTGYGEYRLLGDTLDDAAGEAFDKIAKLFGFPYPGGPVIERLAGEAHWLDVHHYPRVKRRDYAMSFSGVKTAVMYDLLRRGVYDQTKKSAASADPVLVRAVASSLLVAVGDQLVDRVARALEEFRPRALAFVGGVACNQYLRARFQVCADAAQVPLIFPPPALCTDNGAMIAYVGWYRLARGERSSMYLDIGSSS